MMFGYNLTRFIEDLLKRNEDAPPSFTVNLFQDYWTLNSSSKFLYNNQIASLLDDIRAHRIPIDFLDLFAAAKVAFFDGCMIVDIVDHREEGSQSTREVLHPNSESLWADLCLLNQKFGNQWTDQDLLRIESKILMATSPPLCLDPDPHLTRVANHVLRVSTPSVPISLKRKANLNTEEDENEKNKRTKIMQFMAPTNNRVNTNFKLLEVIQRAKQMRPVQHPSPSNSIFTKPDNDTMDTTMGAAQASSPAASVDSKANSKTVTQPQPPPTQNSYVPSSRTQTPIPHPAAQILNTNSRTTHSPSPHGRASPMVPHTAFPANAVPGRAPTPAQQRTFSNSPTVPNPTPTTAPSNFPAGQHFIHPGNTQQRNVKPGVTAPATTYSLQQMQHMQQQQLMYALAQQRAAANANANSNANANANNATGRSTPKPAASGVGVGRGGTPMIGQRVATRSPMPGPMTIQAGQNMIAHLPPQYNPIRMMSATPGAVSGGQPGVQAAFSRPGEQAKPPGQVQAAGQQHAMQPYPIPYHYQFTVAPNGGPAYYQPVRPPGQVAGGGGVAVNMQHGIAGQHHGMNMVQQPGQGGQPTMQQQQALAMAQAQAHARAAQQHQQQTPANPARR